MKRPRRSVAISLFVALAVACAFVVAIAGCSGANDRASTSALEGLDASQAKDDDLKTLNVGSDRTRSSHFRSRSSSAAIRLKCSGRIDHRQATSAIRQPRCSMSALKASRESFGGRKKGEPFSTLRDLA